MRRRPLLTFILTLFFVVLVPAALACEVPAKRAGSCSVLDCDRGPERIECSTRAALHSVPLPKGGDDVPTLDHPRAVTLSLPAWRPSRPAHRAFHSRIAPVAPERSTLFGQAALLLI